MLHLVVCGVRGGGGCVYGGDREKFIHQACGTPRGPRGKKCGQICPLATQCPPSPGQGGSGVQDESDPHHATPMERQVSERVELFTFKGPVLMNRRTEMGGIRVERMQHKRWGGSS